jgi:hypothetical protein
VLHNDSVYKQWKTSRVVHEVDMATLVGGNGGFSPLKPPDIVDRFYDVITAEWAVHLLAKTFCAEKIDRRATVETEDGSPDETGPITKQPIGEDRVEELLADGSVATDISEDPPAE